jgi:hypothetical protein
MEEISPVNSDKKEEKKLLLNMQGAILDVLSVVTKIHGILIEEGREREEVLSEFQLHRNKIKDELVEFEKHLETL